MTALVVTEANLPLDETLTISQEDVDTEKGSRSRLRVGTQLTREEMLHLALMSSENRAAHALGRAFPGGLSAFVKAMNARAALLGMSDTHYVEPTGLSSQNQSSAKDLATLVKAAHEHQLIRELSTRSSAGDTFSRNRTAPPAASAGSFFATFWTSATACRTRCTAGCERQPKACRRKRGANAHLCAATGLIDNHA